MNLNSLDESASHKDGSFTSRLSDKWPDIFGASCTSSVKWELVYLAHQGACKAPPKKLVLFIFNLQVRKSNVSMPNISC